MSDKSLKTFLLQEIGGRNPSPKQRRLIGIISGLLKTSASEIEDMAGGKVITQKIDRTRIHRAAIPHEMFESMAHEYDFHCALAKFMNSE